jgi:small multidrug resistance pump
MVYLFLASAIALEVLGTTALQASRQLTRLGPSVLMVAAYSGAFFLLSLALRDIPVGVAYAIWSGAGIVLISLVGLVVFKQALDLPAIAGMGLIVAGVLVINLLSKTAVH